MLKLVGGRQRDLWDGIHSVAEADEVLDGFLESTKRAYAINRSIRRKFHPRKRTPRPELAAATA